jgi:hypothetical protein
MVKALVVGDGHQVDSRLAGLPNNLGRIVTLTVYVEVDLEPTIP